jgi:hypothetical protein
LALPAFELLSDAPQLLNPLRDGAAWPRCKQESKESAESSPAAQGEKRGSIIITSREQGMIHQITKDLLALGASFNACERSPRMTACTRDTALLSLCVQGRQHTLIEGEFDDRNRDHL